MKHEVEMIKYGSEITPEGLHNKTCFSYSKRHEKLSVIHSTVKSFIIELVCLTKIIICFCKYI